MKKTPFRHKARKISRCATAFLLSLILAVSCYAMPVLGAEPNEADPSFAVESTPETDPSQPVSPEEAQPPEETSAGNSLSEEDASPTLPVSAPEIEAQYDTAPPDTVTLTFRLGAFGTQTLTVEKGQYPSNIPEIPQLPAAWVTGWFDQAGDPVDPGSVPAVQDAVYTARWSRQVSELLDTDRHFAYIKGYENGMFKPNKSVTRAEAAQMLYSLLRDQSWEKKSFSDVGSQWYAEAVSVMAGLGVIQGYSDGSFKPGREITRAEFVTMAVNCDTIMEGGSSFPDVSASFWGAPYIATAAAKGWISGFQDGTFRPNDRITRAQAVTIINNMLGRSVDTEILDRTDVKNFYDMFPEHWAYGNILEAATDHFYTRGANEEVWTGYEPDTVYPEKSGWLKDGSTLYYLDAKTRKFLRGEQVIDGKKYLLDPGTGAAVTGFRMVNSWRRYYKNGLMREDISGLGVVHGPYFIKVYKNANYLIVYAKDEMGRYNTPVRAMRTSCGYSTPTGTFYTPDRYRWLQMVGDTWAQWCTQISGNYLFHSVPNWTQSNMDLEVYEYNCLGETRSLGCIRLNCRDAKWIYDNCQLGTKVTITTSESSGPLGKPAGIQIPSWHTWDPTDPTAYWRCRENGCH